MRGIHRWPVNSPLKKASNAENVSIWWRHHGMIGMWSHLNAFRLKYCAISCNVCRHPARNCAAPRTMIIFEKRVYSLHPVQLTPQLLVTYAYRTWYMPYVFVIPVWPLSNHVIVLTSVMVNQLFTMFPSFQAWLYWFVECEITSDTYNHLSKMGTMFFFCNFSFFFCNAFYPLLIIPLNSFNYFFLGGFIGMMILK